MSTRNVNNYKHFIILLDNCRHKSIKATEKKIVRQKKAEKVLSRKNRMNLFFIIAFYFKIYKLGKICNDYSSSFTHSFVQKQQKPRDFERENYEMRQMI